MKKLIEIAKILQEFQNRCNHAYWCKGCPAYNGKTCRLKAGKYGVPAGRGITDADIKKLESE
jgi:hypothetical protein